MTQVQTTKDESQNNPTPNETATRPADQLYEKKEALAGKEAEKKEELKEEEKATEESAKEEANEEIKLTLPEHSFITEEHLEKIKTLAKEENLTQEQAQKRIEADNDLIASFLTDEKTRKVQIDLAADEWRKQAESDKEIGGERLKETVALATLAVNKLGSPKFKEMIETWRYGDNPEFLRFASKVGKLLKEDSFERGKTAPIPRDVRPADKMYAKPN